MRYVKVSIIILAILITWPEELEDIAHPLKDGLIVLGKASWYAKEGPGVLQTTANMEIFNDNLFTCAIWDLPFNTFIKVTNLENGRYIFVRVNDRGPAKRLVSEGRIIDLTKGAFSQIADLSNGLIKVSIEIVELT